MKVFGDGSAGIYAIRLAATLVLSLQLALYRIFSKILGMERSTALSGMPSGLWLSQELCTTMRSYTLLFFLP